METKKFYELFKNVKVYDSIPALFLSDISTIVISDLHLGYEVAMAEKGIFLPKVQYEKEIILLKRLSEFKFKTLVLNGDIKYEFSETSYHEYKEVLNFFDYIKTKFKNITIVKGNHDTFITRITKKFQLEVVDEIKINKYLITHGHVLPKSFFDEDWDTMIIGHEHPSIALFDELGVKDKLECFLYGNLVDGRNLIVLPAFSYISTGSEVNLLPKEELLSPVLKEYALLDDFKVLAVDEEVGLLYFGKLRNLRNITTM
ncbi:MAG: metallophosphoesterase [Thermoproteota archaeon]|nr:metallophosphoesterase [Candidatus Brockarchaeota archaeon]